MSAPFMPLYVDDYDAATTHLTIEEDGVYLRLLRLCWRTPGCSIPDDPTWIARRLRVDDETFSRVVEPVLTEFFKRKKGRYFSARLQVEFEKYSNKILQRKKAGKLGVAAKSLKSAGVDDDFARRLLKQPEPEPEPEREEREEGAREKMGFDGSKKSRPLSLPERIDAERAEARRLALLRVG